MTEWRAPDGADIRALLLDNSAGDSPGNGDEGSPYSDEQLAAMGYESADLLMRRERAAAEARDAQFLSRGRLPQEPDQERPSPTGTRGARVPTGAGQG